MCAVFVGGCPCFVLSGLFFLLPMRVMIVVMDAVALLLLCRPHFSACLYTRLAKSVGRTSSGVDFHLELSLRTLATYTRTKVEAFHRGAVC